MFGHVGSFLNIFVIFEHFLVIFGQFWSFGSFCHVVLLVFSTFGLGFWVLSLRFILYTSVFQSPQCLIQFAVWCSLSHTEAVALAFSQFSDMYRHLTL